MDDLKMVFLGTHSFNFTLLQNAEAGDEDYQTIDAPGFEAVCEFRCIDDLRATDAPVFTYCQAVAVTEIEDWGLWGANSPSVLVLPEAVQWILCFPVRKLKTRYAPKTRATAPDGEDVFYTFSSVVTNDPSKTFIQVVPDLEGLRLLPPRPGDRLAIIRANNWDWDEEQDTALIRLRDVLEIEFVCGSEVRTS